METIEITAIDYSRLLKLVVSFEDTPATVISRLLDQYEAGQRPKQTHVTASKTVAEYSLSQIPPLVHTKLMQAHFAGQSPLKMTWDSLMRTALESVFISSPSVMDLRRLSGANAVEGKKEDEGYKYIREHNFSYQGVSAEDAVQIIVRCAKALDCTAEFEFEWRNKDGAFKPGQRAIVHI